MERHTLHNPDVIGRIRATQSDSVTSMALDLLGVAPFVQRNSRFEFSLTDLAIEVLATPLSHLPEQLVEFEKGLSKPERQTRSKMIAALGWPGARYTMRYKWHTPCGDDIHLEESGRLRQDGIIEGVLRNVTAEVKAQARIAWLSAHDELTGVMNSDRMGDVLDHVCAFVSREKGHGALLRLRISNLSELNAVYGFETGGRILKEFAKRLSMLVRAPDCVGRLSGKDFGVVLYAANPVSVAALAERLRVALCDTPVESPHGPLFGELDMSVTLIGATSKTRREALNQSKRALDAPDAAVLAIYDKTMGPSISAKTPTGFTEADIIAALNERRISLAYQPIVSAKSRELHHYEALLRLIREDGEVVSAGAFIMAAERLNLVHLLDRRALELASDVLSSDDQLRLALNVSAGTVKDEATADGYLAALKALGPAAERVTIELTETVALDDPAMASRFSIETRALGCDFAIDDFGSGYTTFRNLMAIEADCIKIDGSFVQGIATEKHLQTFVRMMVDLAQTFSVSTVAEMVDSRADADVLRRLGVDYLQGFMFGVPSAAPSRQRKAS